MSALSSIVRKLTADPPQDALAYTASAQPAPNLAPSLSIARAPINESFLSTAARTISITTDVFFASDPAPRHPAAPKRHLSHAFYVLLAAVRAGIALNTITPGCMCTVVRLKTCSRRTSVLSRARSSHRRMVHCGKISTRTVVATRSTAVDWLWEVVHVPWMLWS